MSSEVEAGGMIAAAVIAPVAVAAVTVTAAATALYGAGWVAWQAGALVVNMNREADERIRAQLEKNRQAERERKMLASAAHGKLKETCRQLIKQLETELLKASPDDAQEIKAMISELQEICAEKITDDAEKTETAATVGFSKVEKIVSRRKHLAEVKLTLEKSGHNVDSTLGDVMRSLYVAVSAMEVQELKGENVVCEPEVYERKELQKEFKEVTRDVLDALAEASETANLYGLTSSADAWYRVCFSGVDTLIASLCDPTTTNGEMKRGIVRLKESLENYRSMAPSIKKKLARMVTLYEIYRDVSKALCAPVKNINEFSEPDDLEKELKVLEAKTKRAAECAKLYKQLGSEGYLCMAWSVELQAMGYTTHSREKIAEMTGEKRDYIKLDGKTVPMFEWGDDAMTQLVSLSEECSLQLIVHKDGTVSMQTIAHADGEKTVAVQKKHCESIKKICENLRDKWFIVYDWEETESADKITMIAQWLSGDGNAWKKSDVVTDQRTTGDTGKEGAQRLNKQELK